MGKEVNIKNTSIIKKYIEQYGVNCFENKKHAEEYLRETTGINGLISTETARNIISNSVIKFFSSSNDEFTVFFENDSAVPMYYAVQSSIMVYNWNIFPESVYEVWKASVDRETQQLTKAMYGPPYVSKTVWAVVDSDSNEVGVFDSLQAAKKQLFG